MEKPVFDTKQTQRLLIVCFASLRDVAMALPTVYSFARQNPDIEVDVLTLPAFKRIFINAPSNVRVLKADFRGRNSGLIGLLRLAFGLRKRGYNAVADWQNDWRSRLIVSLLRIGGVRTAATESAICLQKRLLSTRQPLRPAAERYADVLRALGLSVELRFKSVFAEGESVATPIEIADPAVGFAPFAPTKSQTLPPQTTLNVVQRMAEWGWNVYLFGTEADKATLDEWASQTDNTVSLAGKYALDEQIAMMSKLDLMVAMDSSMQHLASIAGTRVVSVWGSTTPAGGSLGYGQRTDDAVCRQLPCQPCSLNGIRGDCHLRYACLNQIDINDLMKKI